MHIYDSLFFEEFKQLEKLFQNIYEQEHGVTIYIESMESTPENISNSIENWDTDYQNLKHCRHIRNILAHETVSDANPLSTAEDLAFLKDFCARLSNGTDPLSQVETQEPPIEYEEPPIVLQTPPTPPPPIPSAPYTPPPKKTFFDKFTSNPGAVGLGCGCLVPIILLIILAILGFMVQKFGW